MEWKDATSYSRGERGKKTPTAFEVCAPGLRIYITNDHRDYPADWIMHCREIGIRDKIIGRVDSVSLEEAKKTALMRVRMKLNALMMSLNGIENHGQQ